MKKLITFKVAQKAILRSNLAAFLLFTVLVGIIVIAISNNLLGHKQLILLKTVQRSFQGQIGSHFEFFTIFVGIIAIVMTNNLQRTQKQLILFKFAKKIISRSKMAAILYFT